MLHNQKPPSSTSSCFCLQASTDERELVISSKPRTYQHWTDVFLLHDMPCNYLSTFQHSSPVCPDHWSVLCMLSVLISYHRVHRWWTFISSNIVLVWSLNRQLMTSSGECRCLRSDVIGNWAHQKLVVEKCVYSDIRDIDYTIIFWCSDHCHLDHRRS